MYGRLPNFVHLQSCFSNTGQREPFSFTVTLLPAYFPFREKLAVCFSTSPGEHCHAYMCIMVMARVLSNPL